MDDDVTRRPSYGVYISQLIKFARVCSHVDDFNARNKCLTAKLLKRGYRYKLRKLVYKLCYEFKKVIDMTDFPDQFRKVIIRYKRILGYNLNVMRQSSCLVINPITVDNFAVLFNCTQVTYSYSF